ncbi:G protein-activated inward rectifier potassium channel 3-like [Astyanax mexicanus]|uniref:G protein-activated inward rectifier potassium channel 3 n=2 Tax=Astyanax mexicanus TaxID=7994 RepID=A0A8T2L003_ASTMX|nr:G protein-activated inward rectifier potassium channel 3-like [Astyanax mexicanus]
MNSGGRRTSSVESRRTSGSAQDGLKVKQASGSSPTLKPKTNMLVTSSGDGTCYQTQIANVDVVLPQGNTQAETGCVSSPLPLPDITLSQNSRLSYSMRRHKSTTDLPYVLQRGYTRNQRISICSPTAAELALLRRCSLFDTAGRPCCRHALSVPNIASPNSSPMRSATATPSRSALCTPVQELEAKTKARSKLVETESAQTPTCTPEERDRRRYVSKDGKCRVDLAHMAERERFLADMFTSFVDLQYRWFLFVFMMCYTVTWFIFAGLYTLNAFLRGDLELPPNSASDVPLGREVCYPNVDGFVSALLFSVETQRTIGYGARTVSSSCHEGVLLVMAQCIVGSMIDALMVGCMFVKISRPKKRAETLLFSRTCVVSNRDDQVCLMFRLGDLRESHMVDAKVRAKLIKSRQTTEGEFLPLQQSEIDLGYETGSDRLFLVEPQVIQHTIDSNSPFWELGPEQLRKQQFEIIVILEGIVEATGMMCQAKTSYIETEIEWGARFEPCMTMEKGVFRVDLRRFHSTYPVPLLLCSAHEAQQLQMLQAGLELPGSYKECGECVVDEEDQEEETLRAQETRVFTIDNIQELNESDSH